jgi:peptidoglycan hydrolase-like protein with peptidoglycan-binding domain
MNKKLISVALTATTAVWALGLFALPLANAQSTSDLQAQISALLAQIAQLQAQLNGSSSGSAMTYDFTNDLTVGSTGADVSSLQQLLINKGYLTAVSAPTGYFGALTQSALAKFQAANGISPAAGYFGPKTRAFVNSMSTGGTTPPSNGGGSVTPPSTGLSVSLGSQNPVSGSLVVSASPATTAAARVPVLAINLTASNSGAVTVTEIKVHKNGVLSDSSIGGAYLVQNGQVLYQYNSLNQGVIDFSGLNLSVAAGQTQTIWVAIDPSAGLSPGNTVSFSVNAATDITAWDASNNALTPSGFFPLNGATFTATTVNNPAVAGLGITTSSIATQITAGTQNNIVGAWNFNVSNSKVWLQGIKFTVIGSANMGDIRNVKLFVNGAQVGQTLATVPTTGAAYFDLSSAPATLGTGNNNLQVYADVMGSPSKNFQFEVLNSYDVLAVDSQYNVPIAVTLTSGADGVISIQQGEITMTQDTGTPTGNIAVGQSGVTLAKFDVYAAGEPVKIKFLDFELDFTGTSSPTSSAALQREVQNVSMVDDAGGQVGTTINNPPSSLSCTVNGTPSVATTSASSAVYKDCFGSASSPINYIVPANTTRVLSLKADIQSFANFATVLAKLDSESTNSPNLQGLISSQTAVSSGAQGSSLSLASTLLSVSANAAYGNQTVTPNSVGAHIGSYAFTASSASGVQINTLSLVAYPGNVAGTTSDIQNLRVMVNGAQYGNEYGVVADGGTYSFSGSPFTVAAGGTTYVDVYADVLSSAASSTTGASSLNGCSGTGTTSNNSVSCSGTQVGQKLIVSTSGSTTMTVGLDSSAPAATQLVMGSTGNTLAAYRFAETSNIENLKITDLTVNQITSSNSAGFQNVTLYNGSNAVGIAGSAATSTTGFTYAFHFATPIIIPQANSLTLTLKGDVASYNSQPLAERATSTFSVATSSVTALGASSNFTPTITGGATGNVMTIQRTILTPSATALGATTNRSKSSVDNLANITFTANSAGSAVLQSLKLTFTGNAYATSTATSTPTFNSGGLGWLNNITLRDQNNNDVLTVDGATATGTCATASTCVATWNLASSTSPFTISGGTSYTFTLQANDSAGAGTNTNSGNITQGLGVSIQGTGDVSYSDSGVISTSTVGLPSTLVPLNVTSISFTQGS